MHSHDTKIDRATSTLVEGAAYAMGYCTGLPPGSPVYPVRENVEHALELYASNDSTNHQRANAIVAEVVGLQCSDSESTYLGVWPWFADEPLEQMNLPDRNWADFIAAMLLDVLIDHRDKIDSDLAAQTEVAVMLACNQIVRRNVGPEYSNICAMGAAVTASAGELFRIQELVNFGRLRLSRLDQHVAGYDLYDEYNSPVYTPILIVELDRILRNVRDRECRRLATRLLRLAWRGVAEHYHPPTGQWAGPHGRMYWDRSNAKIRLFLDPSVRKMATKYSCPPDVLPLFYDSRKFGRTTTRTSPDGKRQATWMDSEACLGTCNDDVFWTQRRPLIGYWSSKQGPCAVFRVRVLANGRDFASARLQSVQYANRALCGIGFAHDHGIWHLTLDRPTNDLFALCDLRIRFELQCDDASVRFDPSVPSQFELIAGDRSAIINIGSDVLAGTKPTWETGSSFCSEPESEELDSNWFPETGPQGGECRNGAWVDAVIHSGSPKSFDLSQHDLPEFVFSAEMTQSKAHETRTTFASRKSERSEAWTCVSTDGKRMHLRLTPNRLPPPLESSLFNWGWRHYPRQWWRRFNQRLVQRVPRLGPVNAQLRRICSAMTKQI